MNADRAMAKLQTVSAEVLQSSITLRVPLLSWQSPWFLDDCSKHAAKAALNRVASEQSVWWDLTSRGQQAMPDQSGLSGGSAARAEALIGVELNGRLVQVGSCHASLNMPEPCNSTLRAYILPDCKTWTLNLPQTLQSVHPSCALLLPVTCWVWTSVAWLKPGCIQAPCFACCGNSCTRGLQLSLKCKLCSAGIQGGHHQTCLRSCCECCKQPIVALWWRSRAHLQSCWPWFPGHAMPLGLHSLKTW